MQLFTYLSRTV